MEPKQMEGGTRAGSPGLSASENQGGGKTGKVATTTASMGVARVEKIENLGFKSDVQEMRQRLTLSLFGWLGLCCMYPSEQLDSEAECFGLPPLDEAPEFPAAAVTGLSGVVWATFTPRPRL